MKPAEVKEVDPDNHLEFHTVTTADTNKKIVISGMTNHQLQTLQDLGSRNKRRGAGASNNDLSQLNSISTFSHVSMNSAQSAEDLEEERRSKETLEAALKAIDGLTKMDVAEIRTMAKPHAAVEVVMEAVVVLLTGRAMPFREAHKLLSNGEFFLQMLKEFDISDVTDEKLRLVEPYVNNPLFRPENVLPVSFCASKFCAWVHGIVHAARYQRGLTHKRIDIVRPTPVLAEPARRDLSYLKPLQRQPLAAPFNREQHSAVNMVGPGRVAGSGEETSFVQKLEKIKATRGQKAHLLSRQGGDQTGSAPHATNILVQNAKPTLRAISRSIELDRAANQSLQQSSVLTADSSLVSRSMSRFDPGPTPLGVSSSLDLPGGFSAVEGARKPTKRESKAMLAVQKKGIDRLASQNVSEGAGNMLGSPKEFRCSDGITKMPYMVLGQVSLNVSKCNFIVVHDFFDTCDATAIMFKPIVQRHNGCQVMCFNYPGQAHTVWPRLSPAEKERGAKEPILNNDWIADRLHELLRHAEEEGDILLTNPFHLVGIGNGACIAAAFCQRWGRDKAYVSGLRSVVSINGFLYPDPQLTSILHSAQQVFESAPHSRPDIPVSFWSRFVFSEDYLLKVNPNLALNIYTAVSNPITNDGRAKITQGCLKHRDMRGALSPDYKPPRAGSDNHIPYLPVQVPVIVLQSTENSLVNGSNVDSFLQGRNCKHLWSHVLNVPSEAMLSHAVETGAQWVGRMSMGPEDYHKYSTLGRLGLKMVLESLRTPRGAFCMWTRNGHVVHQEYKAAVLDLLDVLACPTDEYVGLDVIEAQEAQRQSLLAMTNSKFEDESSLVPELAPPKVGVLFKTEKESTVAGGKKSLSASSGDENDISSVLDAARPKQIVLEDTGDDDSVNLDMADSVQDLLKDIGYTKSHVADDVEEMEEVDQPEEDVYLVEKDEDLVPPALQTRMDSASDYDPLMTPDASMSVASMPRMVDHAASHQATGLAQAQSPNLNAMSRPRMVQALNARMDSASDYDSLMTPDASMSVASMPRMVDHAPSHGATGIAQAQSPTLHAMSRPRMAAEESARMSQSTASILSIPTSSSPATVPGPVVKFHEPVERQEKKEKEYNTVLPPVVLNDLYSLERPDLPTFDTDAAIDSFESAAPIPDYSPASGDIAPTDHTGTKLVRSLKDGVERTYVSSTHQRAGHEWTTLVPDAATALELEAELRQKQQEYLELENRLKEMKAQEDAARITRIEEAQAARREEYGKQDKDLLSKLQSELDERQRERDFAEKQRRVEIKAIEKSLVQQGLVPALAGGLDAGSLASAPVPVPEIAPMRYEHPPDLPPSLVEANDIISKLDRMKEDEIAARKRGTLTVEEYERVKRSMTERQLQRDAMLRQMSNEEKEELFDACAVKLQMIGRGYLGRRKAAATLKQRQLMLLKIQKAIKIQSIMRAHLGKKRFNRIRDLYLNNIKNSYSATQVQRAFRGHIARKYVRRLRRWVSAAKVQRVFRGHLGRLAFAREKQRLEMLRTKELAAAKLQSVWRMKVAKEEFRSLRIHVLAAVEIQRMYRGFLGRKQMARKRLWESTAPGPDRIKLGLEFIEESKQAFERQQEEIDALHRAQERAEARVSHIHAELTESEKELLVLERELQEIDQIERDLSILTHERDLLSQGIEDAAGMPRLAGKGHKDLVMGRESNNDNDPIHERRRKAEAYALEMTIQIKRAEREKKRQELEIEFAAVFQEVEKKKKALERLELSLNDMETTRERKDREFRRLQKNLMQLLMEQKQELDDLREKGIELETATATTAAAAVATAQKAREHEQRSSAMFSQTEELMKFQFMSMSLSYFSSLNMLKSLRDMNADTTSAAITMSADASATAAGAAAAANLPNMKKLNLGANDFVEAHIHKKKAELQQSQESEKEYHRATNNPIPDNVRSWTVSDVARWLDSLSLAQYINAFTEGSVDGPFLMELREEDLVQVLGIKHKLHVRKILISRENLKPLSQQERRNKEAVELEDRADAARGEFGVPSLDTVFSQARNGRIKRVEESLNAGFPIDGEDEKGNTLLLVACQNSNRRLVEMLLVRGAAINHQNAQGNTALHYAFAFDTEGTLGEYLIERGADDTIDNIEGLTAYDGVASG
uniref:SAM domain-containing protein n=1 Tax=Spumella elongata TaxID=89044 RepID=A0A7S3MBB9_9STRA